jgi:hypothetical protein
MLGRALAPSVLSYYCFHYWTRSLAMNFQKRSFAKNYRRTEHCCPKNAVHWNCWNLGNCPRRLG